ncbi:MAG: adenylate/guanylate cyclase domain-containing protein [candidate division NC10 bacterium]|nr:adenylate/guanylate cyclase domain-containing protein [candidate division NC10 bacterium]
MIEQGFRRKLTAILSADAEGYSRLMGEDEESTVQTLTSYRELISGLIQKHRGRVVDSPGDNLLAEFGSVVDAVRSAVEIQEEIKTRNAKLPENRRMAFRIGINLGDVIVEGDRIYGEGINIAARLEGLTEGGGICIAGAVYDQVVNKLDLEYEFVGEQTVKNISKPVRVYRLRTKEASAIQEEPRVSDLPKQPSIAVLPFVNMSGDPEQEYFSDGITEEIITGLSKVPGLFVIARNSCFAYKGKAIKIQQVGKDLGVRYVLEGSVRKAGDRVRITSQVVDAATGHHLWAERYDRHLQDVFALQDEITVNIMRAMQLKMTEGEQACEWIRRGSNNIEAYEKGMKGMQCFRRFTPEGNAEARRLFEECIALDPGYPGPFVMLGWTHLTEVLNGWSGSPPESINLAMELAQKAIALDESQADAYSLLGNIFLMMREYERALQEGERAVALHPNGADHHVWLAMILTTMGRPMEAIELVNKAIRLNPFPPSWYSWSLGNAYLSLERYEKAVAAYRQAIQNSPDFLMAYAGLTAAYSALGKDDDARNAAKEILRIEPRFSADRFASGLAFKDERTTRTLAEGLRKAGLKG